MTMRDVATTYRDRATRSTRRSFLGRTGIVRRLRGVCVRRGCREGVEVGEGAEVRDGIEVEDRGRRTRVEFRSFNNPFLVGAIARPNNSDDLQRRRGS